MTQQGPQPPIIGCGIYHQDPNGNLDPAQTRGLAEYNFEEND